MSFVILNHTNPVLAKTINLIDTKENQAREDISTHSPISTSSPQIISENVPQESDIILPEQVTPVDRLVDIQPTDWAFQALQSLIEQYGILTSYPDQTFRGDRAITRYEFAAALNTILEQIDERMSLERELPLSHNDLEILQRLQAEFSSELSALQGRVGELETLTAELEANQFSTTLSGLIVFGVNAGGFSGDRIVDVTGREITTADPNSAFLYRATLEDV